MGSLGVTEHLSGLLSLGGLPLGTPEIVDHQDFKGTWQGSPAGDPLLAITPEPLGRILRHMRDWPPPPGWLLLRTPMCGGSLRWYLGDQGGVTPQSGSRGAASGDRPHGYRGRRVMRTDGVQLAVVLPQVTCPTGARVPLETRGPRPTLCLSNVANTPTTDKRKGQ